MKDFLPLETIRPVRTPAPYIGGKNRLSKQLVERIAAISHDLYGEAFVGMGGVFLKRTARPKVEVINDISGDVTTLFRILQRHYIAFLDMLRWQLSSRSEFDRLMRMEPETLTDLERAARFLYLQRLSFGGKVDGRNFGVSRTTSSRFDVTKLVPILEDVHERLASVVIERLSFDVFMRRYDREGALFFLDPPYWDCEDDYGEGVFSKADFELLRGVLDGLKGRFILTINDRPETRELFKGFQIEPVKLPYRISGAVTEGRELIITRP